MFSINSIQPLNLVRLLQSLALLFLVYSQSLSAIEIGVLAYRGDEYAIKRWQPTINYLNEVIPDHAFELVPLDLDAMHQAVANNSVDFILTNPGNYVELESEFAISRIVTLKSNGTNSTSPIRSSIIVSANRNDLTNFSHLAGKSLMIASNKAFGGFQIAWLEMQKHGINPFEDLASIRQIGFPQDKIIYAVATGQVDVGIVRSCLLESMAINGDLNPNLIKVLGSDNYPDSPCLASTPGYPDWPIAKHSNTSDMLAKQVALALMRLQPDDTAALAGDYASWTIPVEYQSVHDLFRELKIGPYTWLRQTTLKKFWNDYWQWLLILLIALAWWLWHVFRIEQLVKIRTRQLQQEIQDREEAEKQLLLQQDELAHVARIGTAGELAKGIAHELNQPLSAITSYVQGCEWRLNAGKLSKAEMIEITRRVHQQADRAAGIIDRLRNFLRKGELRLAPTQLNPIVRDALALFSSEAKKHDIGLSVTYMANLPRVNVEVIQLQQVIINLLRNAVDAMRDNDHIHKRIEVTTRRGTQGTVVIDIRDYGQGVRNEDIQKLFDPFFTTKSDGMGIGLSLSQSIIDSFGGHIRLHAKTTPGARFTIELPPFNETTN